MARSEGGSLTTADIIPGIRVMTGTIYLPWSGGLNSTFVLCEALRLGRIVHAHHVRFTIQNRRFLSPAASVAQLDAFAIARAEAEAAAVRKMREVLLNQGHQFALTHSESDWCGGAFELDEKLVLLPHVLNQAFVHGPGDEDRIVFGADIGEYARGAPLLEWLGLANSHASMTSKPVPLIEIYGDWLTPEMQFAALPAELRPLVMSCRRPKLIKGEWTPCGSTRCFVTPEGRHAGRGRQCNCARLVRICPRHLRGWDSSE